MPTDSSERSGFSPMLQRWCSSSPPVWGDSADIINTVVDYLCAASGPVNSSLIWNAATLSLGVFPQTDFTKSQMSECFSVGHISSCQGCISSTADQIFSIVCAAVTVNLITLFTSPPREVHSALLLLPLHLWRGRSEGILEGRTKCPWLV